MKMIVICLSLLFPIIIATEAGPQLDLPVETEKVFRLIVRGTGNTEWHATAFFVGPTTLMTAAHTFAKANQPVIVKNGREVVCRIAKIDKKIDICLLECDEVNEYYSITTAPRVIGFPFKMASETHTAVTDSSRLYFRARFVPGMSGGPLVDQAGFVIGMGVEHNMLKNKESSCKAIPASVLAEFLKK